MHAGVFRDEKLYLGPDADQVGGLVFGDFAGLESWYPQVVRIRANAGYWQVGVQDVFVQEFGSWESSQGTVTIESVTTEGNPSEWRLVGQVAVDDFGDTLAGSFEVAGCIWPPH